MSSNGENEHFCDGMTEEIINALANISSLNVTSRTSSFYFKNREIPISKIAKQLGVNTILEGSVRRYNGMIRVKAQLIQAEEDISIWAQTWDRELGNIFEVQDEISTLVAEKSRECLGHFALPDQLVSPQTDNVTAYEYSLLGRYHKNKWTIENNKLAQKHFEKSLDLDPSHVQSMIGLAEVNSFFGMTGVIPFQEAWSLSSGLIDKVLEIDPYNSEAFYQKARSAFFTEVNFSKAIEFGGKAIEQSPNNSEAQQFMSFLYVLAGKTIEAKKHLDKAFHLDPLNQETLFFKAYFDYMRRDYAASFEQLSSCIEVNPASVSSHALMTLCLIKRREYEKVIHYFDDFGPEYVEADKIGAIGLTYAHLNDKQNTEKYINILLEDVKKTGGFNSDSYLFMIYVVNGEYDKAFEWIKNGIENKSPLLMLRFSDPMVDALRGDERYQKIHDQIFNADFKVNFDAGKNVLLDKEALASYKEQLLRHIEKNEVFLDPELTLKALAEQINLHPNKLSWLINKAYAMNFNQFINNYRVEYFKKIAVKPESNKFSILGLAYDSGFNSKTVFNSYFKKSTGLSPKTWLQSR